MVCEYTLEYSVGAHVHQPKDRSGKRRSLGHEPSAKAGNRQFAVQDNAVQHIEIGDMKDASVRYLFTTAWRPAYPIVGQ